MTNPDWDAIDEAIARGARSSATNGKIRYVPIVARDLIRSFSTAACAALDAYHQGWDR